MTQATQTTLSELATRCVEECLACYRICQECVSYCLEKGGAYADSRHIQALLDCSAVCLACVGVIQRGGSNGHLCLACAEACERCADSCARFDGDELMQRCALWCRRCSKTCREMAA